MAFSRPTLAQIAARIKADLQTALSGSAAWFRRSVERALTGSLAGVSHGMHGHLDWIALQLDIRRCDDDMLAPLHGEPWGVYRNDAVAVQMTATAPGTNGTVVDAGTVLLRSDSARYTVDADATVSAGIATLSITAETADDASNCDDGQELDFETPISGMDGTATVTDTTTVGKDQESIDDYRDRILAFRQSPTRGGSEGDYADWARESGFITRAWEYPRREGAGTVTVYVVDDDSSPITVDSPTIDDIAEYIDQPGRQPTTVDVFVYTPALQLLSPHILLSPNTSDVQAAVTAELTALLAREAHPGGQTFPLSKINEAVSIAAGESDHSITAPVASVVVPFGTLLVLGTPVYGDL